MLRQCFSSGTAADGHTPYKAQPRQNWPKITTYDHIPQIFITSCTWFRRGVLCYRGFRKKLKWHINRNSYIFIQENAFKNVTWKIAAILSWPQCVKTEVQSATIILPHGDITWTPWHLGSLATILFVQLFVQAYNKENIKKFALLAHCEGNSPHKGPVIWKAYD